MDTPVETAKDIPPSQASAEQAVEYSLSSGLVARLASLEISIAFTSYQSSILYFLGRGGGGAICISPACPSPWGSASTVQAG